MSILQFPRAHGPVLRARVLCFFQALVKSWPSSKNPEMRLLLHVLTLWLSDPLGERWGVNDRRTARRIRGGG